MILPEIAEHPKFTVIEVVPCPLVMVAPDGTLQVYVVASATLEIEYASALSPAFTEDEPVIGPPAPCMKRPSSPAPPCRYQ